MRAVTRAWSALLRDRGALLALYEEIPPLDGVTVGSLHLDPYGPTITLRMTLAAFPERPLPEWQAAGCDRFECQVQFLAVDDVHVDGWCPPVVADVRIEQAEPAGHRRIAVGVRARDGSSNLRFTSSDSLGVGHANAYRAGGTERHHAGRVDRLRYTDRLPDVHERAFYDHL